MTSLISYAQNFEDVMLWRALSHVEQGFYIDIGANDPLIDSVSLTFHEHGWRGIHVEPTTYYAERLIQQRPGDTVIQAAVGNGSDVLQFFEIPHTGISTAVPAIAQEHRESGFDVHEITVASITLSAILESCTEPEIHWLKIDVEGFEQQVLSSWRASLLRPWIVVVESTYPNSQIETHQQWEPLILAKGYTFVYFDGLSRFYVASGHDELFRAFSSGPNIFDVMNNGFNLSGSTPFCSNLNKQVLMLQDQLDIERKEGETRLSLREQQANQEKVQQAHNHNEQLRLLQCEHAEREQALSQQLLAGQQELHNIEQEWIKREQLLFEQINQVRQELENLLHAQVPRLSRKSVDH